MLFNGDDQLSDSKEESIRETFRVLHANSCRLPSADTPSENVGPEW